MIDSDIREFEEWANNLPTLDELLKRLSEEGSLKAMQKYNNIVIPSGMTYEFLQYYFEALDEGALDDEALYYALYEWDIK